MEYEQLLFLIKDGNPIERESALGELFSKYQPTVCRYIARRVSCSEQVQDIAAETWLRVLKKIDRFIWDGVPLNRWLFRIAGFVIQEHWKVDKDTINLPDDFDENGEAIIGRKEIGQYIVSILNRDRGHDDGTADNNSPSLKQKADQLLYCALTQLPDIQRHIILLKYFRGYSTSKEIGIALKLKPGTVRQYEKRALAKISQYLTQRGFFDDES